MGGKSDSQSTQQTSQETTSQNATGVLGDNYQSKDALTINNEFPQQVADAFSELVGIVNKSLDLTGDAGNLAVQTLASSTETTKAPDLSVISKLTPVMIIGALGITAAIIFKGTKL